VATEYQKLFKTKTVASTGLGKPHWKVQSEDRGAGCEDEIEASLSSIEEHQLRRVCGVAIGVSVTREGNTFAINESR
jgi:hypothetical protein